MLEETRKEVNMKITILGAGAYGIALSLMFNKKKVELVAKMTRLLFFELTLNTKMNAISLC